jgi:16S rRNA (cytosine1402-N4)-methyltransferase
MTHGADKETKPGRHTPVLLPEVLELLAPVSGGRYLDGTLGLGGHTEGILERTEGKARVLGMDRDAKALSLARERLSPHGDQVTLVNDRYSKFKEALEETGWDSLDGALLDLGVSSMQLDDPGRGFSFLSDGPLDMRMDPAGEDFPAGRLVNRARFEELKRIIWEYGEDPMAGRIARCIVKERVGMPITGTLQLAGIVERAYPPARRAKSRNHPATRTFMALRMAVNGELDELASFLEEIVPLLRPGGRVAVISFHSLEDRQVKRAFRNLEKGCLCPTSIPQCVCGKVPVLRVLTKKPLTPCREEVAANSRARSAKLRVAEKLKTPGDAL